MGLDFIRRAAPSFHRALDRRAIELRTPTLISNDVAVLARTAQADLCEGSTVVAGERLLVRKVEQGLVLQKGGTVVGTFNNPPAEYFSVVASGAGIAGGEVKVIHPLSGVAEVCLCE